MGKDTSIAVVGGTRSEHVRAIENSSGYCGKFRGIEMQLMLPAILHNILDGSVASHVTPLVAGGVRRDVQLT